MAYTQSLACITIENYLQPLGHPIHLEPPSEPQPPNAYMLSSKLTRTNAPSKDCLDNKDAQAAAARLQAVMLAVMGGLSALTSGFWGAYGKSLYIFLHRLYLIHCKGDRHGRRRVMNLVILGFIVQLVVSSPLVMALPHIQPKRCHVHSRIRIQGCFVQPPLYFALRPNRRGLPRELGNVFRCNERIYI